MKFVTLLGSSGLQTFISILVCFVIIQKRWSYFEPHPLRTKKKKHTKRKIFGFEECPVYESLLDSSVYTTLSDIDFVSNIKFAGFSFKQPCVQIKINFDTVLVSPMNAMILSVYSLVFNKV